MSLLTQIFGSRNQRLLKQYQKTVREINALEPALEQLSDEALKAKTPEFKERLAKGEDIDKLLPEAFAVCREASKRVLKICLLYTSPSPRDLSTSRMPSSA